MAHYPLYANIVPFASATAIDSIRAFVATARIREDDDVAAHDRRAIARTVLRCGASSRMAMRFNPQCVSFRFRPSRLRLALNLEITVHVPIHLEILPGPRFRGVGEAAGERGIGQNAEDAVGQRLGGDGGEEAGAGFTQQVLIIGLGLAHCSTSYRIMWH
jgi:hypothetical protein